MEVPVKDSHYIKNVNEGFIKGIIDGMYDWVRVIDREDNIIYLNKAMAEGIKSYPIGKKCYEAIGKEFPCENCVSRKAVFNGVPQEKEEIIGNRIFSVMSSPIKNNNGEVTAVIEVLRDITQTRRLQDEIIRQNKKLQNDLDIAKKLQCSLLPKTLPEDKINFSFLYKPCEALGGDFLDIYKIDEDNTGIYIADVSGHGVSASMLTVFLRSSINKGILSPAEVLTRLYKDFNRNKFDQDLYISLFYAVINLKNNIITFSNAGLNVSPIIYNKGRFDILRVPGIPISDWLDTPGYTDQSVSLMHGDKIFLYTDGIIEIKNNRNEQFGEDRLLDILLNTDAEPSSILNEVIKHAYEFSGIRNAAQMHDDITMALLEIK